MGQLSINLEDYESKLERLNTFVEKMSSIDWNNENAIQFCIERGLQNTNILMPQSINLQSVLSDLRSFDYQSIKEKILICKRQINHLRIVKFDNYNASYQNYINNNLTNKSNQLNAFFNFPINNTRIDIYLTNISRQLTQLVGSLVPDVDELFEQFKYENKNYVIFGKNGAGKTTLLRQIADSMFKNAIVVPANRTVMQSSNDYVGLHLNYNLNQMLKEQTSLTYLIREINNKSLASYEEGISKNYVLRTRFYEIFSTLGLDRDIVVDKESLFLKGDNISQYSMENASDGEKSIAYLIMATLLTPQHSFIFIDEPERHLI